MRAEFGPGSGQGVCSRRGGLGVFCFLIAIVGCCRRVTDSGLRSSARQRGGGFRAALHSVTDACNHEAGSRSDPERHSRRDPEPAEQPRNAHLRNAVCAERPAATLDGREIEKVTSRGAMRSRGRGLRYAR